MKPSEELKEGKFILFNKKITRVAKVKAPDKNNAVFVLLEDVVDRNVYETSFQNLDFCPSCPYYSVITPKEKNAVFIGFEKDALAFDFGGKRLLVPFNQTNFDLGSFDFENGKSYTLTFAQNFLIDAK